MYKLIFFIIILFLMCNYQDNTNNYININEGIYKKNDEIARLEYVREIILDEKKHKLGKIRFTYIDMDNNLYFNDYGSRKFVKYDSLGNYIGDIGKKGLGPGEYQYPSDLLTDSNDVTYLFDTGVKKLILYRNNEFLKERQLNSDIDLPLDTHIFRIILNNNKVLMSYYIIDDMKNYLKELKTFHIYNRELNYQKSLPVFFPEIYKKYNLDNVMGVYYNVDNEFIYYTFEMFPYLYKMDLNGNLIGVYGKIPQDFILVNKEKSTNSDIIDLIKYYAEFSKVTEFFQLIRDEYLIFGYGKKRFNVPIEELDYNTAYDYTMNINCLIFNKKGENIKVDFNEQLFFSTYVTPDGLLYTLASDEPDNRIIKVYKIIIEKGKE